DVCSQPYGELLPHDYADATCTLPKTCKDCGATDGDPNGHKGGTATCTTQAVCETCGESYGELIPHDYADATCTLPKTCKVCGATDGDPKGHDWLDATCVAPKTCSVCSLTEGEPHGQHVFDKVIETVGPKCSAEGYTIYGCSAGECGLTENRDYVARTAHNLVTINEFDFVSCIECGQTYRNITTIVTTGNGDLCLGCGEAECVCSVIVEWNGYVKPTDPEAITAGEKFTKTEVPEKDNEALEIGKGLIKLVSETEATYTIVLNGETTIEVKGTEVVVDLYKYESVTSVEITSDVDATVAFYMILR
ncbi:MAG: hypothetical protein IJX02_04570, partial [Clostridia bacterium]|nr:hypothetical protein [Clostridia bacterium]